MSATVGERDSYLGSELAEPDHDDASHWVHHDEVNASTNCLSTSSPPRVGAKGHPATPPGTEQRQEH